MTTKKIIKESEARVLIFLNQVHETQRYLMYMSAKLEVDYGYLNKIVKGLEFKGWITRARALSNNKVYYLLTELGKSKIEIAKRAVGEVQNE